MMLQVVAKRKFDLLWRSACILKKLKAKRKAERASLLRRLRYRKAIDNMKHFDTFHRAIKPFMFFAQLFGIMPLANILHSDPSAVTFRLCTWSSCFTTFFLTLGCVRSFSFTLDLMSVGLNSKLVVGLVFNWTCVLIAIYFTDLARCWPQLIRHWTRVDMIMLFPPYRLPNITLQRKLSLFACLFMLLTAVDHSLYHATNYYNYRMRMLQCQTNVTHITLRSYLVNDHYKDAFKILPYNIVTVFYLFFHQFAYTFIWSYLDIFIMLLSLALATRFQQLAARVLTLRNRFVSDAVWSDLRHDHIKMSEFMALVNRHLSNAIILSSAGNLFFICNICLNIFDVQRYPINYVYFWYSLIFQITRILSVFLCAAKINEASLLPLQTLYMVPTVYYTDEVQRFVQQITTECIGLSGYHCFYVTRKAIFGLASTIVTYEFMLLQLNADNRQLALPDLCA